MNHTVEVLRQGSELGDCVLGCGWQGARSAAVFVKWSRIPGLRKIFNYGNTLLFDSRGDLNL